MICSNSTSKEFFQHNHFPPKRDMLDKLRFRILQAIILDRKPRCENEPSKTICCTESGGVSQKRLGGKNNQPSKTITCTGRGWSFKSSQKMQKRNLQKSPLPYEGNAPTSMGMGGSPGAPLTGEPSSMASCKDH